MKKITNRIIEFSDLLRFLWKEKMWFLIPFIVLLMIFGVIMIFAQTTGIGPFIYSIF